VGAFRQGSDSMRIDHGKKCSSDRFCGRSEMPAQGDTHLKNQAPRCARSGIPPLICAQIHHSEAPSERATSRHKIGMRLASALGEGRLSVPRMRLSQAPPEGAASSYIAPKPIIQDQFLSLYQEERLSPGEIRMAKRVRGEAAPSGSDSLGCFVWAQRGGLLQERFFGMLPPSRFPRAWD
jgi:hypothetical protein